MTVWVVYFKGTNRGAYVVAPTCAAAKEAFEARYDAGHPIRARHEQNVEKSHFPETVVLLPHDPRLSELGLRYADSRKGDN
jgi:hypothetical protein